MTDVLVMKDYFSQDNGEADVLGEHVCEKSSSPLVFEFYDSFECLESEWRRLDQQIESSPFQRFSWIKSIYNHSRFSGADEHGRKTSPFIIAGRIDQQLIFILPMAVERSLTGTYLRCAGAKSTDYNGMVLHPRCAKKLGKVDLQRLVQAVKSQVPDLDVVHFSRSPLGGLPAPWVADGTFTSWQAEYSSHSLQLSNPWNVLYQRVRSPKSRQRIRSKTRAFKRTGHISFRQIRSLSERDVAFEKIMDWKTDHLSSLGNLNPFGSGDNPSDTRMVFKASVQDDDPASIKVFGLYQDGNLVAGMLAFVDHSNFYNLVSAYAPGIPSKYSIGTQLLVKTLELACRSGKTNYDFLIGDERYKEDWCDTTTPLQHHIMPLTFKGRILAGSIRASQHVRRVIKRSPVLSRIVKGIVRAGAAKNDIGNPSDIALDGSEAGTEEATNINKRVA